MSVNYCGIALASCFRNLLELFILMQFPDVLYTSDLQFGFKKGFSTDLCTGLLKLASSWYIHQESKVRRALLDMSKAFDLVGHGLLFELLLERNLPCSVTRFCCTVKVVNSCRLGGVVSFLHLFLYQMVYDRVESYPQSYLQFILTSFCSVRKILVWVVIGRGC